MGAEGTEHGRPPWLGERAFPATEGVALGGADGEQHPPHVGHRARHGVTGQRPAIAAPALGRDRLRHPRAGVRGVLREGRQRQLGNRGEERVAVEQALEQADPAGTRRQLARPLGGVQLSNSAAST